ncbi:MAG: 4Fe-4S binding protein [Candidatus Geothermincolales bacterium]
MDAHTHDMGATGNSKSRVVKKRYLAHGRSRGLIHWTRRAVQSAALAAFLLLSWAAAYPPSRLVRENLFLRVDPLGALAAFFRAGAFLPLWPAMGLLFLSFFSGRFFCGWICPLGSVMEIVPSAYRLKKRKIGRLRPRGLNGRAIPAGTRRFRVKYLLLIVLLALFPLGVNLLWLFDPLVITNRAAVLVLSGSIPFLFLGLLVLAQAAGPRFWCQDICPLGALLSVAGGAGRALVGEKALLGLIKDEGACIHCGRCAEECPFHITEVADTRESGKVRTLDCAMCGECVVACPAEGALSLACFGRTLAASKGPGKTSRRVERPGAKRSVTDSLDAG